MTQPTLDGGPPVPGARLWPRHITGGAIDHPAWLRACAERSYVGNCRCGDYLVPEPPEQIGQRLDYRAACRRDECSYELEAPGGRVLRRSSRHSEMPGGWWDHRFKTGA